VADGNFKADHIRLENDEDDVWLSEGSGMIPKRREYFTFLASAIERLTVSGFFFFFSFFFFFRGIRDQPGTCNWFNTQCNRSIQPVTLCINQLPVPDSSLFLVLIHRLFFLHTAGMQLFYL
jgi:hypothetical protein